LPPKRAIDYDIKQLADDTSMEVYPTDIGVMLCADRGGHAVHSVLPSAPPSVLNCVCVKDVLVSINGEAVANASRDTVTAMLQHSSALSFLCDSLLYFVRILLQSQIQKPIFI
jgi:C-terminal processing protease CtpA/Prc